MYALPTPVLALLALMIALVVIAFIGFIFDDKTEHPYTAIRSYEAPILSKAPSTPVNDKLFIYGQDAGVSNSSTA